MSTKNDEKLTLSLRWGSHTDTLLQSLETSYDDQDFVDMTLACDGQSVHAHKVVVSACSSILRQLLKDNPCPHPIVILKDVSMTELRRLLEFMYCGRVTVEQHQLDKLLQAAKALGIRGLANQDSLEGMEVQNEANSTKCEDEQRLQHRLRRQRSESPPANKKLRPVPPLQSILAQTLLQNTVAVQSQAQLQPSLPQNQSLPPSSVPQSESQSAGAPSPSHTLARLLSQSPISARSTPQGNEIKNEQNLMRTEEDSGGGVEDMMDMALDMKQESFDVGGLEFELDNPAAALELEYNNPETDEYIDTESYHLRHQSAPSNEPSAQENIGKATAFMLSLAKRANQTGHHYSQPSTDRKLSFHEPRPCPVCRKMYRDAATLRTHMSMMHPTARPITSPILPPANGEGGSDNRLAFYEARPCSICGKMYRDAASLRTHMSIMHTMWRDGFECSCKQVFQTKHEMYQHRRSHGKTRECSIR